MVRFATNALGSSRSVTRDAWIAGCTLVVMQASGLAQAQTTPPAKTESEIKTPYLDNYTPSEEVKRRAMGPLRIIKQMGDQKKTATPTPTPAAAAPSPAPAPAPKPKAEDTARTEKKAPALETPAATPPAVVVAPAPAPAQAPVAAAVAPPPEPPKATKPVNLDVIPIQQDPPIYSRSMMRDMSRAVVKVAFDVNPDGRTSDIEVTYSKNPRLNRSATDAVAKWLFRPIDETVRVEIDLMFSID